MNFSDGSFNVRILRREQVADDTICLTLVSADASALPRFAAGSHIDVHIDDGLVRQYSLLNNPLAENGDHYKIGVLRDPNSRGGSVTIHERFREGGVVRIGLPRCNFPLIVEGQHSFLIAGGIGITPMLSMAQTLKADAKQFELHYCARTREKAAFLQEIESAGLAANTMLHLDDGSQEQKFHPGQTLRTPREHHHVYVCGPSGFIDFVVESAKAAGWPASQIHVERFKSDAITVGAPFVVRAERSGIETEVKPEETIVSALSRMGLVIPVSCEQGVCGTCLTRVLEGKPDHRDSYQTDEEKDRSDHLTLCCSRSLSPRLVLDI
jgi:vanillate O-demethylase ferredoxin subunit